MLYCIPRYPNLLAHFSYLSYTPINISLYRINLACNSGTPIINHQRDNCSTRLQHGSPLERLAIVFRRNNEKSIAEKLQNLMTVLSKLMTAVVVYRQSMKHMNY